LTQRTADHHSSNRTLQSGRRTEGLPSGPRSSLPDTHQEWRCASNKIAPKSRSAVYSVLPSNCQTVRQAYGYNWDSVADVYISNETGLGRRWQFTYGVINLFETNLIDSMNNDRPCSRLNRYEAGLSACRPSSDIEKDSLKVRRGGMTAFVACGSPGGEIRQ
jgi:hypothetical protein